MLEYLWQSSQLAWSLAQGVLVIYALGLALEQWMGRAEPEQPLSDVVFNIQYTLFYLLAGALALPLFQRMGEALRDSIGGSLLTLELPDHVLGHVSGIVIYVLIFDFFYYWWHRLQHSPIMWPQHEFHHADRSVNVSTGIRHHWLEEPLRVFFIWLPMQLLIDLQTVQLTEFWLFLALWGYFTHLNVKLPLGRLTAVFAGPQFHRIHHSIELQHYNRNFAAYLPIYDLIFGTYFRPGREEYPRTGLQDAKDFNRIGIAAMSPFVRWYALLRRGGRLADRGTPES